MDLNSQKGISLIEGMIAAAIIGIGFMAVFTLSTATTRVLMTTIDREKGNMIANAVFEDLITDTTNLLSYNNMDFKTGRAGKDAYQIKQTKWAGIANKRLGSPKSKDKREILVVKKSKQGKGKEIFIVTINIETRDGKAKNQFKRVFNVP